MSFANFVPEVWSDQLLLDRDKKTIGVQNSWRKYEGEVKKGGDRVHIQGLSGATIKDMPADGVIDDPEDISDDSLELDITEKKYINFKVDDIDKVQANVDEMQAIVSKTSNNLSVIQDKFVYDLALGTPGKVIDAYSTGKELSSKNLLIYLNDALAYIRSSDLFDNGELYVEADSYVLGKLQLAFTAIGQTNNAEIKNGYRGPLFGASWYETNQTPLKDGSGNDVTDYSAADAIHHIIIRTGEAVAFAEQKSIAFEPFKVYKGFGDGMKGYCLYGGKVVKPKELVIIKAKLAAETSI